MAKLMGIIGVDALILGLQCGWVPTVSDAPVNAEMLLLRQQEQASLAQKQQVICRHEQAMMRLENESLADWQWRQWKEREQYIWNMKNLQRDGLRLDVTPIN